MISLLVLLVLVVIISILGILNKKLRGKIEVVGANAVLKLHDERRYAGNCRETRCITMRRRRTSELYAGD